jgi:hypothetical protein
MALECIAEQLLGTPSNAAQRQTTSETSAFWDEHIAKVLTSAGLLSPQHRDRSARATAHTGRSPTEPRRLVQSSRRMTQTYVHRYWPAAPPYGAGSFLAPITGRSFLGGDHRNQGRIS